MMKRDKYLLVKGAAGLGNRILFLLSALLYARLCNRIVIVDWCDLNYSDDGSNTFSRLFCSASCHPLSELPGSDCVRPDIWRGNLDNSFHDMLLCHHTEKMPPLHCLHLLTVDMRSLDYEEDILVASGFFERIRDFRKHLQGTADKLRAMPTQKILRLLIREHLSLHPSIQNQLDEFRSSKFKQEMVGVHVRYTDKRANLSVTHRALKRLLRRNPELTVFLSTDNASVQQQFESLYANVITTPKWFPTNEANMHNNTDCPNRVENAIEALLDVYLLASCKHLIVDQRSSFSYVASILWDDSNGSLKDLAPGRILPAWLRHRIWLSGKRLRFVYRRLRRGAPPWFQ